MVYLKKISLINFISHANTEINFDENNKILIDGKSGAGKSSIVEAIVWCLYGNGRSQNRNLIKKGRSEATVSIYLSDGIFSYKIKRSIIKSGSQHVEVYKSIDGEVYSEYIASGVRDSQEFIEKELIRSSYELFINSVVYMQDRSNSFISKSSIEKKDILMEIIGVNEINLYFEKSKKKRDEVQRLADIIDGSIKDKKKSLSELTKKLTDTDTLNNSKKSIIEKIEELSDKKTRLESISSENIRYSNELVSLRENNSTLNDKIKEININIEEKESSIKDINSIQGSVKVDLLIAKKRLEVVEKEIEEIRKIELDNFEILNKRLSIMADKSRYIDYLHEIDRIYDQLKPLVEESSSCKRFNETCPYCGDDCKLTSGIKKQINLFKKEIDRLEEKRILQEKEEEAWGERLMKIPEERKIDSEGRNNLIAERDSLKSDILDLGSKMLRTLEVSSISTQVDVLKEYLSKHSDELSKNNEKILKIVDKVESDDFRGVTSQLSDLNFLIKSSEKTLTDVEIALRMNDFIESQVNILKEDLEALEGQFKEKNDILKVLNLLVSAFGPNGIKKMVIENTIPLLESKINNILSILSSFKVEIETQKSKASKDGEIDGLFINIINENGEILDFENYSGGEKLKIIVAISEALASIQRVGFRIFDELFVGLDEESIIGFSEIIEKLQSKFKQVICISHLKNIKDTFDDSIEIIKINGTSKINI